MFDMTEERCHAETADCFTNIKYSSVVPQAIWGRMAHCKTSYIYISCMCTIMRRKKVAHLLTFMFLPLGNLYFLAFGVWYMCVCVSILQIAVGWEVFSWRYRRVWLLWRLGRDRGMFSSMWCELWRMVAILCCQQRTSEIPVINDCSVVWSPHMHQYRGCVKFCLFQKELMQHAGVKTYFFYPRISGSIFKKCG